MKHITSYFTNEQELIKSIIQVHNEGKDIECDPMYFKGNFWKNGLNKPKYKFDLNPQVPECIEADATNLPLDNNILNSIILDPPFLICNRKSQYEYYSSKTHTFFKSFQELEKCYKGILENAYRCLKKNGLLIFKCQDYTDSKTIMTHCIVVPKEVKEDDYNAYDSLDHDYGFGREECRLCDSWDEKLAYAYMLLKDNNVEELDIFKNQVIEVWKKLFGNKDYTPTPKDVFNYIDRDGSNGDLTGKDGFLILKERYGNYVDHSCSLSNKDILDRLINDKEFVKRFIFNRESYITICGDEYRGYNIKTIGFQYDYDNNYINTGTEERPSYEDVGEFWDKLKEYEKDNDVYLKGN